MSKYRYPGVHSFTEADSALFFGREREIKELYRLLILNPVVVLFGRSGTGKTSLLQAGVTPLLYPRLLQPVKIRLNDTSKPVSRQIWEQFNEGDFLPLDTPDDLSLAEYCRRFDGVAGGEAMSPVLLLDQFEELFTLYGDLPEKREAFITQLAELVQGATRDADAPGVRIVISIRSDFLYLLNRVSTRIPAILRCRYELAPLEEANARKAIMAPAGLPGDYLSQPFTYSSAALDTVLDGLTAQSDTVDSAREVEAFLLQQFCQRIERRLIDQNTAAGFEVTPDFFGGQKGIEDMRDALYAEVLAKFEPAGRLRVQRLVEEKLISAERRIFQERETIKRELGVSDADLTLLCRDRLLREEPRGGSYYYEISHDTLLAPILRARKVRLEAEEREQNRKKVRRLVGIVGLLLIVVASAVAFAIWALNQREKVKEVLQQVEKEKQETEKQRGIAEANEQIANRNAEEARFNLIKAYEANKLAQTNLKKAETEAKNASKALALQQKALSDVVRLTLNDAFSLVYRLDYESALEKMKAAAALGVLQEVVGDSLLEPVYFFAEAGKIDRARSILDTAAQLIGRNIAGFGRLETRQDFRKAIETCSPGRLRGLDARYFPVMVKIPGGTDTLGSDEGEWYASANEFPQHLVTLNAFKMAATETTWWQYYLYCTATGTELPRIPAGWGGEGDNPVVNVSWYDAVTYAGWMNARAGLTPAVSGEGDDLRVNLQGGYRLPTEAEWEYAARAGTNLIYSGSDDIDLVAWHYDNSDGRTHRVAEKKANAFVLYDMSGNVHEWCWDWYGAYGAQALENPTGPGQGTDRVFRGGGWGFITLDTRATYRLHVKPDHRDRDLGFRLVSSL